MINCLIVDDEPLAQKVIESHLERFENLSLVRICSNALQAFETLGKRDVDLMFLDIRMPLMNGIDFLKALKNPPAVIFTTAYSEFAVDSYEFEAVDYLLKPVTFERFEKSVQKYLKQSQSVDLPPGYTYFKVNGKLIKIEHSTIVYVQSIKDYLIIYTTSGNHITHMTMKYITELLPETLFIRIHRSFLIGISHLTGVGTNEIHLDKVRIPIGDSFKKEMLSLRSRIIKIR
jgi:DNA-binding LytR/AlgR family response regulator